MDGYSLLLAVTFSRETVPAVRHQVFTAAVRCGMTSDRLDDFLVAVNEIMTNVVRHGGGTGQLGLWQDEDLVCQVIDHGAGFDADAYLNGERPRPSPSGGMGLWLARQTSDKLTIDSGPAGTTISVRSHLDSTSALDPEARLPIYERRPPSPSPGAPPC